MLINFLIFFILVFQPSVFSEFQIFKKILSNGLTILVIPTNSNQHVSCQIWYRVGSKHEQLHEKGIAHLIEHMIFKGTELLSESDIGQITNLLSGYSNAATSYDWTKYYFNLPVDYWKQILPIMADCMRNCTFKDDILNAEYRVVIQELNMNKDHYQRLLLQKLLTAIFHDHPYHYPIVGYTYNLSAMHQADLHSFYKQYYGPNNAYFIMTGNIDPQEVFDQVEKHFAALPPTEKEIPAIPLHYNDMTAHEISLYRDVKACQCLIAFPIPGFGKRKNHLVDLLSILLTQGKSSLLHERLVDTLQLTSFVQAFALDLFDVDLFIMSFQPYNQSDIPRIIDEINNILRSVGEGHMTVPEIEKAYNMLRKEIYLAMEINSELADIIGKISLGTGNENNFFDYLNPREKTDQIRTELITFVRQYLRPIQMSKAVILPLPETEKKEWQQIQQEQNIIDQSMLQERERISEVEGAVYANKINVNEFYPRVYPKPSIHKLDNNVTMLVHNKPDLPTFSLIMNLKADGDYDSDELPGLYHLLTYMLRESGTKYHTNNELTQILDAHALSIQFSIGSIAMTGFAKDLSLAVQLLVEILTSIEFDEKILDKVRQMAISDYIQANDSAAFWKDEIIKKYLYKNHPYSKNQLGTMESLMSITKQQLIDFMQQYIVPDQAQLAIVGDLNNIDVDVLCQQFNDWHGPAVQSIEYPEIAPTNPTILSHTFDRDQVVLSFAGLTNINRLHPDFDKLSLLSHIVSGNMDSILFRLREKTGLFYTIQGSFTKYAAEQPGIWEISCLVSPDKLEAAKNVILQTIQQIHSAISTDQLDAAKRKMLYAIDNYYSTNDSIAATFLFLNKYQLPWDFFEQRKHQLDVIQIGEIKTIAKTILDPKNLIMAQVGSI